MAAKYAMWVGGHSVVDSERSPPMSRGGSVSRYIDDDGITKFWLQPRTAARYRFGVSIPTPVLVPNGDDERRLKLAIVGYKFATRDELVTAEDRATTIVTKISIYDGPNLLKSSDNGGPGWKGDVHLLKTPGSTDLFEWIGVNSNPLSWGVSVTFDVVVTFNSNIPDVSAYGEFSISAVGADFIY